MTTENDDKSSRYEYYLNKSFAVDREGFQRSQPTRNLVRWIFDLVRNILVVGLLQFLANKSHSTILTIASVAGVMLLTMYLVSFQDTFLVTPFRRLKSSKLAAVLNILLTGIVVMALVFASSTLVSKAIRDVAESYAIK
jgi:hypothetical protein